MPWPNSRHDLRAPAENYYEFSDIGWQRFNGLYGRRAGFKRAAELLFEAMVASGSIADLDTVFFPYAMCWRHYVELELKGLLADLRALADLEPEAEHHHSIARLWEGCRELMVAHFSHDTGEDFQAAGRVIRQLAAMDPDGQSFRYDTRRGGKPSLPGVDKINLARFQEAMVAVAAYFEGVTSHVDYTLDSKREMDAYYAAEFGQSWSDFA